MEAVNQVKGDPRVIRVLLGLLMAVLLMAGLLARAVEPPLQESVARVVQRSGMREQVAEIAAMIQVQIRAQLNAPRNGTTGLAPDKRKSLIASVDAAYATDALLRYIEAALATSLPETASAEVLAWLESDPGQRISLREAEASKEFAAPGKVRDATETMTPPPAARSDRYHRLVEATHRVAGQAQITLGIVAGTSYVLASAAAVGEAKAPDPDAIRASLEPRRASLAASLGKAIDALMAITYEPISDADLDAYLAFAESPAGHVFHEATVRAIDHALYQAARESTRLFTEKLQSRQAPAVEAQRTQASE